MDQWLEDFKQTIDAATPRLLKLSESQSEAPLSAEGWSSKQTIGHLIDSAANNHARFVLAQLKDDLLFPGYEQDGWVRVQQYQQASWPHLVELWRAYNVHLLHVMSYVPKEKLTNRCTQHSLQTIAFETVDETEPATLEYLMKDYVVHLKHHLSQIFGEG
ncbi:MAG TPA: DinB family protein [Pyrinomonadaceae bacterium]|nr:DinB family protein [Pyrinomonadaceae bacterium]